MEEVFVVEEGDGVDREGAGIVDGEFSEEDF